MDVAAAKARLSAKKQISQSLRVASASQPMADPAPHRYSSPANFIPPPSPPSSALPNKKLSFSNVTSSPADESSEDMTDGAVAAPAVPAADSHPAPVEGTDGEMMQVFLRIRPMNETEKREGDEHTLLIDNASTVRAVAPEGSQAFKNGERAGTFSFTRVYDETVGQAELFTSIMANPTRRAVLDGQHSHIFAYGMTNAGKTFTITGNDDIPGILPRTLGSVFKNIDSVDCSVASKLPAGATSKDFVVLVSYMEIYNEQCYDLLGGVPGAGAGAGASSTTSFATSMRGGSSAAPAPPGGINHAAAVRVPLQIRDGRDGIAYVRGLRQVPVKSAVSALEVMKEGAANKRVAETHMNADSSRSHTIFTVSIYLRLAPTASEGGETGSSTCAADVVHPTTGGPSAGYQLWSRVNVVDLAGSERQSRTNSQGARLKEAGSINNSLMQLMKCFETMRYNSLHPDSKRLVPFRDTKLTRFFADSFGGLTTGTTIMIVNAGPASSDFDETLHALKYGALVKDVRVNKDRIVTRWEPGQYGDNGRRLKAGASEVETEIVVSEIAVAATAGAGKAGSKGVSKAGSSNGIAMNGGKRPVAPAPVHGPQPTRKGSASDVLAAAAPGKRGHKESMSSTVSGSSAISMSLISAALSGHGHGQTGDEFGSMLSRADSSYSMYSHAVEVDHMAVDNICAAGPRSHSQGTSAVAHEASAGKLKEAVEAALSQQQLEWESERTELMENTELLTRENNALAEELEGIADSVAGVEEEVREEVAQEMAARLAAVETEYNVKMTAQAQRFEERISKLMKLHALKVGNVSESEEEVEERHPVKPSRKTKVSTSVLPHLRGANAAKKSGAHSLSSRTDRTSTVSTRSSLNTDCDPDEESESKLEELHAQVAECEAEIDRLNTRHENDTKAMQQSIASHAAEMAVLRGKLASAEAAARSAAEASQDAEDTIQEQASEIQRLTEALASAQTALEAKDEELEAALSSSSSSQAKSGKAHKPTVSLASHKEELGRVQAALEATKEKLTATNAIVNELSATLESTTQLNHQLSVQLESTERATQQVQAAHTEEMEAVRAELTLRTTDVYQLTAELESAKAAAAAARAARLLGPTMASTVHPAAVPASHSPSACSVASEHDVASAILAAGKARDATLPTAFAVMSAKVTLAASSSCFFSAPSVAAAEATKEQADAASRAGKRARSAATSSVTTASSLVPPRKRSRGNGVVGESDAATTATVASTRTAKPSAAATSSASSSEAVSSGIMRPKRLGAPSGMSSPSPPTSPAPIRSPLMRSPFAAKAANANGQPLVTYGAKHKKAVASMSTLLTSPEDDAMGMHESAPALAPSAATHRTSKAVVAVPPPQPPSVREGVRTTTAASRGKTVPASQLPTRTPIAQRLRSRR